MAKGMLDPTVYGFREGLLDTVRRDMKVIPVQREDGELVGRVVRGELPGCEARGTFRWESVSGAATVLGVRAATWRTGFGRLIAPTYDVRHWPDTVQDTEAPLPDPLDATLKDRWGENILYFAVAGEVDGRELLVRDDWDGSVEVLDRTADAATGRRGKQVVGRLHQGSLTHTRVTVDHGAGIERESALFGVMVLLPFARRVWERDSEIIGELF